MNPLNSWRLAAAACLSLAGAAPAMAALVCNATATPVQMVYFENDPNPTTGAWSVTINCTRGPADPTTSAYTLRADDGFNPGAGSTNQAVNGTGAANQMAYDLFRTSPGTGVWGYTNATDFAGTINFATALTASVTHVFYSRIAAGLNKNAKIFTDTVTMRLRYDNGPGNVDVFPTFPVTINNQSVCLLSTPPGNIVFNYTSFQTVPATTSTAYAVRCTTGEPYTMALDATTGSLLNLNYSLALSNPGGQTGTGFPQNFTINGTIAAGQSGTCAAGVCTSAPQQRTLTVSY
ncbi:spore coat protein U domain-containing protein [Polaromonas sp. LjRoot131]|uniref:spore coat protein U domain-containing protein n=1 Tax=Polaromonas sp. LjRoot131 TaxID=3342262 RepID=UPI003ECD7AA4